MKNYCFNSIKVRLIRCKDSCNNISCYRFNSIKVRLIREQLESNSKSIKFQFHKGSINTVLTLTL